MTFMTRPLKKRTMGLARACLYGLLCGLLPLCGCGKGAQGKKIVKKAIQIKGSDTMVNVEQAWAEEYKKINPDIVIEVSGGGSGVGIAALEKGTIGIAAASREMKPEEFEQTKKNTGKEPKEFTVGYDALAIFVHKNNPIERITLEQLAALFIEGSTVNAWKQMNIVIPNVKNDRIVLVSRQSSSGTYSFFRERVLKKKDFRLGSLDMNGSKEVVELISNTKTAIGYSGMGYATAAVKMLTVALTAKDTAYSPTVENTLAKKYPLARSLHLYTLGEPQGEEKRFIEWLLSAAGQAILRDNGYVPVPVAAQVPKSS